LKKNISEEEVELVIRTQWKDLEMNPFEQVFHFFKVTFRWVEENTEKELFILKLIKNLVEATTFENKTENRDVLYGLNSLIEERKILIKNKNKEAV
jgi:hypothetical protein